MGLSKNGEYPIPSYTQIHGYFNGRSLINHGMCFQGNWPRNFTFSGSFIISWPKKDHCGRANPSRSSYHISHIYVCIERSGEEYEKNPGPNLLGSIYISKFCAIVLSFWSNNGRQCWYVGHEGPRGPPCLPCHQPFCIVFLLESCEVMLKLYQIVV